MAGKVLTQITVMLREDELKALQELSERERRKPRDQAAMLLRECLTERGLLSCEQTAIAPTDETPAVSPPAFDPVVQILIEAAARGRALRLQREAAQREEQVSHDVPEHTDNTPHDH